MITTSEEITYNEDECTLPYSLEEIEKYGVIIRYAESKGWRPKFQDYTGTPFNWELTSPDNKLRIRYRDVEKKVRYTDMRSGKEGSIEYERKRYLSLYSTEKGNVIFRLNRFEEESWLMYRPELQIQIFDFYVDMLSSLI